MIHRDMNRRSCRPINRLAIYRNCSIRLLSEDIPVYSNMNAERDANSTWYALWRDNLVDLMFERAKLGWSNELIESTRIINHIT